MGQPLINAILQNSQCYDYAKFLADACQYNTDGQFCTDILSSENFRFAFSTTRFSCISGSACSSPTCHSAIKNLTNAEYGCCINYFNATALRLLGIQLPSLSYNLWNSCGASIPDECNSTVIAEILSEEGEDITKIPAAHGFQVIIKASHWIAAAALCMIILLYQ